MRDARQAFTQNGRFALWSVTPMPFPARREARRVPGKERLHVAVRDDNQAIGAAMRKLVAFGDGFRWLHLESK